MIIKNFEIKNVIQQDFNFYLFYGSNIGLIEDTINEIIKPNFSKNLFNYNESEVLENPEEFNENIYNESFFEKDKLIIINKATDKILKILTNIINKKLNGIAIIIKSDNLDKKSKLRTCFEKDKKLICVPFYPDKDQILSKLAYNFLKDKKILISPSDINLIVRKCNNDRYKLINELNKIECFTKNGKKINKEKLLKLINIDENYSVSELVNNCLAQNKKETLTILNENNFSYEDCIMILRSFIIKAKKLLVLSKSFEINQNINLTILSAKPPIFWKEKEITIKQIYKWKPTNIKKLIYSLSKIELQIKKNVNHSINIIIDFILHQCFLKN